MGKELTKDEAGLLQGLEAIIDEGLQSFVEVGSSLMRIRDGKLYRATHGRFEDYCSERFNLKRQRAYELIKAANVTTAVSEISDKPVERESHAAELGKIDDPQVQAEVWEEAVETAPKDSGGDPKVTAKHIEKVAERMGAAIVTCCNCGHDQFDEHGDCESCHEPSVVPVFDGNAECGVAKDRIRAVFSHWPVSCRDLISPLLEELAEEDNEDW